MNEQEKRTYTDWGIKHVAKGLVRSDRFDVTYVHTWIENEVRSGRAKPDTYVVVSRQVTTTPWEENHDPL